MARQRLLVIDLARSLALLAMVIFHLTWDLDMFGLIPQGTATNGFFWYFARITAGSFIFLAGLSLALAHADGIRWPAFAKRQVKIIAAAGLVSVATWFAMPAVWIFYGILHSIALSSLLGLIVLRWPPLALLGLAALVFALPWAWSDPAFGGFLIWTGLSGEAPATADFEPLFPWFAPFLAGMALAKSGTGRAFRARIEPEPKPFLTALAWPGRHSLLLYLIHQPLLIGGLTSLLWLFSVSR